MTVLAHVGHWAIQLLYLIPVLFVVGAIVWSKIQERREAAEEAEPSLAEAPNTDAHGRD